MIEHDVLLLQRLAEAGDAEAFSAIITQYGGMVFGTCRRVLGNETSARDAAQETFFHLLKSAHRITGSLGSWLHRVAVNRSLDLLREDVARRQREAAYSAQAWQAADRWDDIAPAVDEALEDLPAEDRQLLVRRFLEGQSTVQIAADEGVSQPTVSRRVVAALEHLRERLRRRGVLVKAGVLSEVLPQAAEAAPAALLRGLGNMVLGQAATAGAAASTGSLAAKLSSAVALATGASLPVKFAGLAIAVAIGGGAVVAHRAAERADRSHSQGTMPASEAAGPIRSPGYGGASPGSVFAGPGEAASALHPGAPADVSSGLPPVGAKSTVPIGFLAQATPGATGSALAGQSFGVSGGGNSSTSFSFGQQRQLTDPRTGKPSGRGYGGGGGGGTHVGLGGSGSAVKLISLWPVQKELALTPEQRAAVNAIVDPIREFERNMAADAPLGAARAPALAARFAEADRLVADARPQISRLLNARQNQRLEQICLQDAGTDALFQTNVVKALGLTREQQRRLEDLRRQLNDDAGALHGFGPGGARRPPGTQRDLAALLQESHRRMEAVLTPGQQAHFAAMKGEPFTFPGGYRQGGGFGGSGAGGGAGAGSRPW